MKESSLRTPDENLQLLLDRYSLAESDFDPQPRAGHLYGELTKFGLAHVWADIEKTQHARAHVLVIDSEYVWAAAHTFDRRGNTHDWRDWEDVYWNIPLSGHADSLTLMPYELATQGAFPREREYAQKRYNYIIHALAIFASTASRYDALHQTEVRKRPVPETWAQSDPYAGEPYGPRINAEEMIIHGLPLHPAVVQALHTAPKMTEIE